MELKNVKNNLIFSIIPAVIAMVVVSNMAVKTTYADCQDIYGGNQNCTVTGHFKIQKWVKLDGQDHWKDDVDIDLNDSSENDKAILFKVQVTADVTNDAGVDTSTISFDNLKLKDSLPDELKFLSDRSEDALTEKWDNFKPGETKTFFYTTKLTDAEKNKDGEFEKCVVNKASLYMDSDFQGSSDATVCYKKTGEVLGASTELPKTGALPTEGIVGAGLIALGLLLKAKNAKYVKSRILKAVATK